jgi:membrane fusion protein (multidrug efflux system)
MSEKRSLATPISIAVAVICAAWAIYATQHKPVAGAGAGGPPTGAARNNAPASVMLVQVRSERVSQKLEALGNARANESVDISTKTSNIVTAVTFRDGERVKRGQVLVQLDDAQARADVAAAQAAVTESESIYNRSRELMNTQALSKSSFDQLEATLKANRARLQAASARLEDTVIRAPFSGRVGLRRVSVGTLISPRRCHHHAR